MSDCLAYLHAITSVMYMRTGIFVYRVADWLFCVPGCVCFCLCVCLPADTLTALSYNNCGGFEILIICCWYCIFLVSSNVNEIAEQFLKDNFFSKCEFDE